MNERQMKTGAKTWSGKPIAHPDDVGLLDASAAVHEFKNRLPRQDAETQAHADYMKDLATSAAGHHLVGMRAAHAAGDDESAAEHGQAYAAAMKHIGADPMATPPQEVLDRIIAEKPRLYSFKRHRGDDVLNPPDVLPVVPKPTESQALLAQLAALGRGGK